MCTAAVVPVCIVAPVTLARQHFYEIPTIQSISGAFLFGLPYLVACDLAEQGREYTAHMVKLNFRLYELMHRAQMKIARNKIVLDCGRIPRNPLRQMVENSLWPGPT